MLPSNICDFLYTSEFPNRLLLFDTNGVCDFDLSTAVGVGCSNRPFVLFTSPNLGPDLDTALDIFAEKLPKISFPFIAFN